MTEVCVPFFEEISTKLEAIAKCWVNAFEVAALLTPEAA